MDDLISRKAAIEAALKICSGKTEPGSLDEYGATVLYGFVDVVLKQLPTVDASPVVHARPVWVAPFYPDAKICMWKCASLCSACGDYVAESWKYCPSCGARMDGE